MTFSWNKKCFNVEIYILKLSEFSPTGPSSDKQLTQVKHHSAHFEFERYLICVNCLSDDALWAKIHSASMHNFRHLNISLFEEKVIHSKMLYQYAPRQSTQQHIYKSFLLDTA